MDTLERPFGLWTATAMVVGGMIGAGIFVLPASLAPFGWTSVLAWIAGGLGVATIASVLSKLMQSRPAEPSIITLCGDIMGLLFGRLLAWVYWIAVVVSLPVLALAAMAYLFHLAPGLPSGPWEGALGGTAILAILTAINLRGAREAGNLQIVTTVLKLVPLLLVIGIVVRLAIAEPQTYSATHIAPASMANLTPALGVAFFAMLAFENASLMAERVRDPQRNVARATMLGLLLVFSIYIIVSTGIIAALPAAELENSSAPIALFVSRYMGSWAGDAVALFAAISAIGCLNCLVLLLGEIPLGMVRDGQLPDWMATENANEIASVPLISGVALAVVLMIASVTGFGEKVLDFLLRLTTASAVWFYVGICIAAFRLGLLRALSAIGLAFCLWVLIGTGLEAGILGICLILVGIPLHFLLGDRTRPRYSAPA
ncbi:MAG: amino acid permease [Novosphingobium sp.]|nr:amino acid permease [Novosphingobium sp.]